MHSGRQRGAIIALSLASLLPLACGGDARTAHPLGPDAAPRDASATDGQPDPADIGAGRVDSPPLPPLVDDRRVYTPADDGPVVVRVTVRDEAAFVAVEANAPGARAGVLFSAADSATPANGTIEQRGSTSRSAIQKSYQIKLAAGAAPWRGTRTINLLKHPFDLTRVRNRLSFDAFRRVASFTSLRTGFVHLFIDSVDRGLYEWVEEPDEAFLAAHGLDPGGALYKAKKFGFEPIDAATAADPERLAAIVAAKGTPDLAKLRRMAAAVNDPGQAIDDVVAHYFDRDNYLTWLAVNVLTADFDSTTQNFILYSPPGFEGWYFLPWDYDGAWGSNDQPGEPRRPRWRQGLANWWSVVLHRRFLSRPDNVAALDARIAEVAGTIDDASTAALLARTHDVVKAFISAPPDIDNLPCDERGTPGAVSQWETEYARIAGNAGRSRDEYAATLDRPMPFWLNTPAVTAPGRVTFSWDPSFQLRGAPIGYDVEINASDSFDPATIVLFAAGLTAPALTTDALPSGHYFWRVVARGAGDPSVDWQASYNDYLFVDVP